MVSVLENLNKEEKLVFKLRNLFENYGYEKLSVNLLEDYETYYLHGEMIKTESLLKVIDPQGKLYVLRPDMTMPIAKKIAGETRNDYISNKIYYVDDIFRIDKKNFASISQKKQIGIELLGEKSIYGDYEIINLAIEALEEISPKYHIDIGHAEFLKIIFEEAEFNHEEKEHLISLFENRASSDLEKYLEKFQLDKRVENLIKSIPNLYGDFDKVIGIIEELDLDFNRLSHIILELKILKETLPKAKIELDFSMINNLNYYTGIIFKGYLEGISQVVLQGGRYDNLSQNFGKKIDAIGFAINLQDVFERLLADENKKMTELLIYKNMAGLLPKLEEMRKEIKALRVEAYSDKLMENIESLKKKYKKIYLFEDGKAGEI